MTTRFAHPLNADRICAVCERGEHRNCRNPRCECLAGRTVHHHANRPPRPKEDRMAEPATVTPITKNQTTRGGEVKIALRKVDELPNEVRLTLAARVLGALEENPIDDGSWYELITYPSRVGAGGVSAKLNKKPELAGYEFIGRGQVVYVRRRPA